MDSLHKLGSDFKILNTGSKRVICSVSIELSQDNMKILEVAEANQGWVTFTKLRERQPMFSQKDRYQRCIDQLVKEGLAWVDGQGLADSSSSKNVFANNGEDDGKVYWFPSIMDIKQGAGGVQEAEDLKLINNS